MFIVLFDTETTGVTNTSDVVELASLNFRAGEQPSFYQSRMKPETLIPEAVIAIHGISNEDVANCKPSTEVVPGWYEHIKALANEDEIIICGHNVSFDIRMVKKHIPEITKHRTLCTLSLAKKVVPESQDKKLGTLYNHLGFTKSYEAHAALGDCSMTYHILQKMLELSDMSLAQVVEKQNQHRKVV